jgi:hypothetical protein
MSIELLLALGGVLVAATVFSSLLSFVAANRVNCRIFGKLAVERVEAPSRNESSSLTAWKKCEL